MADESDELVRLREENDRLRVRLSALERDASEGRSAELLTSLLRAVPAFIARLDSELRITYLNQLAPGHEYADVIGTSVRHFIPEEHHEVAIGCINRVLETAVVDSYRSLGAAEKGRTAHYHTIVSPIEEVDGTRGACLIAMDVSEDVAREEALRRSEQKLRVALDATRIGLWSWDVRTDTVVWDERMHEIFGRDEPAALSDYVEVAVHPTDRARVAVESADNLASGQWLSSAHRIVQPGGDVRWVIVAGTSFLDADGNMERVVGGHLDVTEQRDLEDQLRQSQRMEAVGSLTAGIAHNFNNLLMAILPSLELLRDVVPSSYQPVIEDASSAGERAADLVRQLMTYAGQRRLPARRSREIVPIIETAVGICRRTFDRHIRLKVEVGEGVSRVWCDAGALEQVLMNVLLNARDALLEGGVSDPQILIRVSETDDDVVVEIRDNGPGMSADVQRQIFEPFFTTKSLADGTGLGLATSFAIVREHGGSLRCESELDQGTAFTIRLPQTGASTSVSTQQAVENAEGRRPQKILVVDDERIVRAVVTRILERAGHEVVQADSRKQALERVDGGTDIDVVLLDRSMPDGPGDLLVPELRERAPHAKILFFTGQSAAGRDAGVDGVVQKPVTRDVLLQAIDSTLES